MARLTTYLRNWFRKEPVEADLDHEVRSFVDLRTDEHISRGMPPADARRAALLECGGIEQLKESVREIRAGTLLEQFVQDIRFGLRMLGKQPGFTAVAVMTIALGIGVNSSIFTLFNGIVLRPLPLRDSDRLVDVYQTIHGDYSRAILGGPNLLSYPDYKEYRDSNEVFSAVAAYKPEWRATLGTTRQEFNGQLATCNYFDVVQVAAALGRTFGPSDCSRPGAEPVIVLSDNFWKTHYQSDPKIIGKTIRLNRVELTVIGVAPAEFQGTAIQPAQFWAPTTMGPAAVSGDDRLLDGENVSWLSVLGRLKDGVTLQQARANLDVITARIDKRTPGRHTVLTLSTATLAGQPDMRIVIFAVGAVILAAVGLILLIACANIANLMLARAAARTREVAVRLAVGASRGRLIRQLLTESLLIAFLGGTLGLALSVVSQPALVRLFLSRIPEGVIWLPLGHGPDIRVIGYTFGLTILTGVAFGLAPALQGTRPDLTHALKNENSRSLDRAGRGRLRGFLVGGQMAGCMVLLISAGLLLRGLFHAQTVDPGFTMDQHIGAVTYRLASSGYTQERAAAFNRLLLERLKALPGVEEVAPAGSAPLAGMHYVGTFNKVGQTDRHQIEFNVVGGRFFALLDVPITRGRTFTEAECNTGAAVLVMSESTARALWPGEDPIGKQVKAGLATENKVYEVVGVAKDVQIADLGDSRKHYFYVPTGPATQNIITAMLVRTRDRFDDSAEAVRAVAGPLDNDLALQVALLRNNIEQWVEPARICVALAIVLGCLGLVLAAIGIYGTVSYSVAGRVREIGIRVTLGARAADVLKVILRQSLRPVVIGAVTGIALCAVVSRVLSVLLFGVSPFDPVAYVSVAAFLLCVAFLASYLPARKALRIDPMAAIRHE